MIPIYTCDNEDCVEVGRLFVVGRGAEATCPSCGWSLIATNKTGEEVEPSDG